MTSKVLLFGNPVAGSLSPVMQNAAFAALGIECLYELREVDAGGLPGAIAELRGDERIVGANVTIPHKEAVIALLDDLDPQAARIGAVNTISRQGIRLKGWNTDVEGFRRAIKEKSPSPVTGENSKSPSPSGGGQGGGTVVVVSDQGVADRHAQPLIKALSSAGLSAALHLVPAGEPAKDLAVLAGIYEALAAAGVDRRGALIALGGGSVGDVAGFAAATWMRGIRYIQMPTTLLAMVDSSIGGKTAINLPAGKNLAGAVHQPSAIFCDLDYLASLPNEEFRTSLAEVIKAAIIADRSFAEWLSANLPGVLRRDSSSIREAVARSIAIKATVVASDPTETGERAILNYGHTVGHALERVIGFGRVRHGEAVAWGMEVAARISRMAEACTQASVTAQHALLTDAGLLAERPAASHAKLIDAMRHDKKSQSGEPRWVLLREIGRADYGRRVDPSIVRAALAEVLPE